MSGPCVIVGAGAQGRVTLEVWRAARPDARFVFVDDDRARRGQRVLDAEIVGTTNDLVALAGEVILAIGNPKTRASMAARLAGVRWGNAVHPSSVVMPSARVGQGSVVFASAVVNTQAAVGNHVIVNTGCIVEHDCVLGDFTNLSPGVRMGGLVSIGAGAFLSTGVTLARRARVGEGSIVGAGAVVVRDLPDHVLAYGVPAKVIGPVGDDFDWRRAV